MKEEKMRLRRAIRRKLLQMDERTYLQKSAQIREFLFSTEDWIRAETIGVTVSIFPEVDTREIIRKGWAEGKRMAVPKCFPEKRMMRYYIIHDFHDLKRGYSNLWEPDPESSREVGKGEISLLIIPGVVFSRNGHRIGYGGGYFDRFLADFPGKTVALAFEEQIVDEVPAESHDRKVALIVSEKGFISANDH